MPDDLSAPRHRILVADDEQQILDSFVTLLCRSDKDKDETRLDELDEKLFGRRNPLPFPPAFDVVTCLQGKDAVAEVIRAKQEDAPFSVIFLDMRMPPGPDGLWTAERIRDVDPLVNIVIVTAYSDINPSRIAARILPKDKFLYLQKPLHVHEIQQFAVALGAKWLAEKKLLQANELLEARVRQRTSELASAMNVLKEENEIRRLAEEALRKAEANLQQKAIDLEATNTALQVLFRQKNEAQKAVENKITFNMKEMVKPFIEKLRKSGLTERQASFLDIIESNLQEILAPFMHCISRKYLDLTPNEINIANLIRQGKKTREIAQLMNMSKRTVDFHRDKIRTKIGIKNKSASLKIVLRQLDLDLGEVQADIKTRRKRS